MKIGDLSKEISKALQEYTTEVEEGLEEAKVDIAKRAVRELKGTSPKLTGDYAKGWSRKEVGTVQVIHNKTDYQLTHLLENGHVNRDGSRTQGESHIKPTEEKAIKEFIDETERAIRG